jgi:hypothetical protein
MADSVDEIGAARAGSQLQTQLYVNKRCAQLADAIRAEFRDLADASFDWRSPRADDHYAEYWDAGFLKRLGLTDHIGALAEFWPARGGPHWDALALVTLPGESTRGVLLAEGKSYPDEMLRGSPLKATDPKSIRAIENALAWTQGVLGVPLDTGAWTGPLYQNANRLAHVCWLRSRGIKAYLVHLLFANDPHRPTSEAEWADALSAANDALGLAGRPLDFAGHVFLAAGTRAELLL